MFRLEVESLPHSKMLEDNRKIDAFLKEDFSEKHHFEDSGDFLAWAEESFPLVITKQDPVSSEILSILIFSWFSPDLCSKYYEELLKKRLILEPATSSLSIQQFDFSLHGITDKKFCLMEINMPEKEVDESYISSLKTVAKQTFAKFHFSKEELVQQEIENVRQRFHQWIEGSVLEDTKYFLVLASRGFIERRSYRLLCRLILSQHLMHKTLIKWAIHAPEARHVTCRLLSSKLTFPFTSKNVLGVFVGVHFIHKYDFFSDEHLLRAIQKLIPDSQYVPESIYVFQKQDTPFKLIYLEVEKKGEEAFSLHERHLLSHSLREQVKSSIEKLQPSVFMVSNEEEIAKNILILSREISSVSDIPQIIIHFEEQTEKDARFRIILVAPSNQYRLSLERYFQAHTKEVTYLPSRTQIARHLGEKQQIEAHVFRLYLPKHPSLLRSDASLNFYTARNQISELLNLIIGDFRDFNGGIILKQGETLEQFKRLFCIHPSDLLEDFFYGLTPIEIQSTISLDAIVTLFELFLESRNQNLLRASEYFLKHFRKGNQTYFIFRARNAEAYESLIEALKEIAHENDQWIYTQIWEKESYSLGYIFESHESAHHEHFSRQLQRGIDNWKNNLENLRTLRLAIYSKPLSLDPRIRGGEDKNAILRMLFEGLTRIDYRGEIALGVARSVEVSQDKKVYTFLLLSSYWSNGTPVTAGDFVYAWKAVLSPHFKTPFAYLFYPIKHAKEVKGGKVHSDFLGVKALDESTLEVTLQNPTPYFLELVALPQFFPVNQKVDILEPSWPTQQGEKFVCNGAFTLKTQHSIYGYELVKNPSYFDAAEIQLNSITIKKASISEIQEMLLHDQIDWAGAPLGFINFPPLPRTTGEPIVLPNELLQWYVFNTQKYPLNCLKLRQALSLVVNRMRILHSIPPGSWPAFTVLPLHQTRASSMEENREKGIQLFKEALQELRLEQKNFPSLKIMYTEGGVRSTIAKTIQEDWEEALGIRCCIEAYEWSSLFTKISEGDFQISAMDWIALVNDPSYTLEIFRKTNTLINFPKWYHPEYERLLNQAYEETEKQKRLVYYGLAENMLLQQAVVLPLLRTLPQSMKKSRVKLLHGSSMKSWDFKWTTIQTSQNQERK